MFAAQKVQDFVDRAKALGLEVELSTPTRSNTPPDIRLSFAGQELYTAAGPVIGGVWAAGWAAGRACGGSGGSTPTVVGLTEAAALADASEAQTRRWCNEGRWASVAIPLGKTYAFHEDALREFLATWKKPGRGRPATDPPGTSPESRLPPG